MLDSSAEAEAVETMSAVIADKTTVRRIARAPQSEARWSHCSASASNGERAEGRVAPKLLHQAELPVPPELAASTNAVTDLSCKSGFALPEKGPQLMVLGGRSVDPG